MTPTTPVTPKVFISYRRTDTAGHAGRLYDAMVVRFGEDNVFMDVDMQPGVDFVARINAVVAACHVLLVVIGPDWARPASGETSPRLADPEDFVRLEVSTALRRSDVTVIPLLVERATMPDPDDLPDDLKALTRRNALELSDLRWHDDARRLMAIIEQILAQAEPETARAPSAPPSVASGHGDGPRGPVAPVAAASASVLLKRYRWPAVAAAMVIVLLLIIVLPGGGDDTGSVATPTTPAPTVTAASEDAKGPLGVPASCEDGGRPEFAREADAVRLWETCSVAELSNVTGASHSYLEFRDPAEASAALESARLFELEEGGYTACRDPGLDRVYSGQAWCAENADTIEIYWHDPDSRLMGLTTFASPPTTLENAVKAWSTIA